MDLTLEKKYQLLLDISQKVRDTLDLDEIMEPFLDTVKTVLDYDAAGIFVLNQDLVRGRHESPLGMNVCPTETASTGEADRQVLPLYATLFNLYLPFEIAQCKGIGS